jgi:hypothetical protein
MCLGIRGIMFLRIVGLVHDQGSPNLTITSRLKMKAGKDWAVLPVYVLVSARRVSDWGRRIGERYGQRLEMGSWRLGMSPRCVAWNRQCSRSQNAILYVL